MAIIDYIDGPNRDVYLDISTLNTEIHPIDIYKEMRTLRADNEDLRKYDLFMSADGNVTKTATTSTERYVTLLDGTRIIPYDSTHVLTIIGTIITDSGQSGVNCFDRTLLSSSTVVDINYVPPQVEVITVAGNNYDTELANIQDDLKRVLGLMHENIYIDNPVYDEDNNLISSRVRIYSTPGDVGSINNVIATYSINSNGDGAGKFMTWSQIQDS